MKFAIDYYGIDHVMYGTDYPCWDPAPCLKLLENVTLSEADKHKLFYANARRILGLKDPAPAKTEPSASRRWPDQSAGVEFVIAGLVPAIRAFWNSRRSRRGCPARLAMTWRGRSESFRPSEARAGIHIPCADDLSAAGYGFRVRAFGAPWNDRGEVAINAAQTARRRSPICRSRRPSCTPRNPCRRCAARTCPTSCRAAPSRSPWRRASRCRGRAPRS